MDKIDKIRDKCGVFGISSNKPISIQLIIEGLRLLQHRGQESAGISYSEDNKISTIKGLGLVDDVFKDNFTKFVKNGIGHVRYSTTGDSSIEEAQPLGDSVISVAFNGTISNYYKFGTFKTDTEFIFSFFRNRLNNLISSAIPDFINLADGAYSLLILLNDGTLLGLRDPRGFHPLTLGIINDVIVFSSEDSVIKQLGGKVIKHILPGELIMVKDGEIIYDRIIYEDGLPYSTCSFEYIYFSRPDSNIDGYSVYIARRRLGEILAEKHPAKGDIVVPVPDSSRPIAIGFSKRSGIPLEEALVRTISSVRSFIMPTQDKRKEVLEEKFGIVSELVKGKRIILIDDSIVRGNTMRRIASMLRSAGAKEIHVRIGSPMIKYPCYMGIDFPRREELIAYNRSEIEISKELGVDSIEYLTVEEMLQAIGRKDLCTACFSGNYPLKFRYDFKELEKVFGK
ncbi:amidophosphoribosyltransferase [Saccharolobus caldissimus]|uniref:Amidophosphoribosyltransferase n=1 Tax=Saccharolobus caldissimus TaxID=1702097 RepID=A0AAQ4CNE9_9CREN|nr:amidophosphoribosyltransferase [Saccharolobus caldissimus]